jgi:TATA-binding protein-associated factor
MLQKFLAAIVAEEWAQEHEVTSPQAPPLIETSSLARDMASKALKWLQSDPPNAYHEMLVTLARIHTDCIHLLQLFAQDCKIPISTIPYLGTTIDIHGVDPEAFTIKTAQTAMGSAFTKLKDSLGRTKKREVSALVEKRLQVVASIDRYIELKTQYDIRVSAAFASAFVALKSTPDKVSPVVKGIMNGIKVCRYNDISIAIILSHTALLAE